MGAKAKARKADHRKKQKQMRKAAERATYASRALAGSNSKRGKLKAKRATKFRPVRHVATSCGNPGCSRAGCSPDLAAPKFNDSNDPRVRFKTAEQQDRQ
jgi:hypothetical protein